MYETVDIDNLLQELKEQLEEQDKNNLRDFLKKNNSERIYDKRNQKITKFYYF